MTPVLKNIIVEKLNNIVDKYNNPCHNKNESYDTNESYPMIPINKQNK